MKVWLDNVGRYTFGVLGGLFIISVIVLATIKVAEMVEASCI